MVDVAVPQGIVEGISQELQRTPKGIPKEYQRKPTQSLNGISQESQRSSTGITKRKRQGI